MLRASLTDEITEVSPMLSSNTPPPFAVLLAEEVRLVHQITHWEHTLDLAYLRYERLQNGLPLPPVPPGTVASLLLSREQRYTELSEFILLLKARLSTARCQLTFVRAEIGHPSL